MSRELRKKGRNYTPCTGAVSRLPTTVVDSSFVRRPVWQVEHLCLLPSCLPRRPFGLTWTSWKQLAAMSSCHHHLFHPDFLHPESRLPSNQPAYKTFMLYGQQWGSQIPYSIRTNHNDTQKNLEQETCQIIRTLNKAG